MHVTLYNNNNNNNNNNIKKKKKNIENHDIGYACLKRMGKKGKRKTKAADEHKS